VTDASDERPPAPEPVRPAGTLPGRRIGIGFKTSPQAVDWPTLDATWAAAGELDVFDAGWVNDHLVHMGRPKGGPSLEALTLAAALAHHVPGKWIGHGVLSNTFRHPAVLAKAATVLDHVTGGRFIVGLGAGWHEPEHTPFGIPLPPIGERISRLISSVRVIRAMTSSAAASLPGVDLEDPFYPLSGATNEPPPVSPLGPPIWLGGQKERGLRLAAELGDGWLMPGDRAGDVEYFREKRDDLRRRLEATGREADAFGFVGQVMSPGGSDPGGRRDALVTARAFVDAGATHVVVGITAAGGPDALRLAARDVAVPLRGEVG
jgi:alkanesulfonate monooxygenase SsuD/methylene tetrahydromethanopterin reductase-like flavin-dependent oxidoreductase (luciferase family)